MYSSKSDGDDDSLYIPELHEDIESASYTSIDDIPDDHSTLRQLLIGEKRKNVQHIEENTIIREENEKLQQQNAKLQFDMRNMEFVVSGLNKCIELLKERIMDKDDREAKEKNNYFMNYSRSFSASENDMVVDIFSTEESQELFEDLQCKTRVLEAEVLCKNRVIDDLVRNVEENANTLQRVSEQSKTLALEEKVKSVQRENRQLCALAEEFEKERAEWNGMRATIKEKMTKLDADQALLRDVALALEKENIELKQKLQMTS